MVQQSRLIALALSLALILSATTQAADPTNEALMGLDGRVSLRVDGEDVGTLSPIMATPAWQFARLKPTAYQQSGDVRQFTLRVDDAKTPAIDGEATMRAAGDRANARWTFRAADALELPALAVSLDVQRSIAIGGSWNVDGKEGTFPSLTGPVILFGGQTKSLALTTASGKTVHFEFDQPTPVLIQDNLQWTPTFSIRIGSQGIKLAKDDTYEVAMTLSTSGGLSAKMDGAVRIVAGKEWIPLKTELDIEPGSALDFSQMGFTQAPAGKDGRVVADNEGHFTFEKTPDKPQRFYGVNLCFDANYLSKDRVDQLTGRLVRLGYNSIRIHHYESKLTDGKTGFDWNAEQLDRLDYLMAACKKRGIYVTTDLYVSRPVSAQQIGMPGDANWSYKIKVLIPVHEPAFEDWKTFSRKLLEHVNPYTNVRYADEPTLAWLSMVNEGNFANYWTDIWASREWTLRWNGWLKKRYSNTATLAEAWGDELQLDETLEPMNRKSGPVALPASIYGDTARLGDCKIFLGELERDVFSRMEKFLRDEVKTKALLTNMNGWSNFVPSQLARAEFDYVDDHFYVDHPEFIEKDWSLPSRSGNQNPLTQGAPGGRGGSLLRMWGKPFTVSEYNYAAPGRFRGVGGILTGAMAGLQDWGAVWRFAYSHTSDGMFEPRPMGYFDLVSDPLNQAADRAAIMLYLRGDLTPAKGRVTLALARDDLERSWTTTVPQLTSGPNWLAWVTGVGNSIEDNNATPTTSPLTKKTLTLPTGWTKPAPDGLTAFGADPAKLLAALKSHGILPAANATDPSKNIFESDTGEILLDGSRGLLQFDTDRTAGGYAESGRTITSKRAGVTITDLSIGATVFVTSLDGQPIRTSGRLLVTHLTDLQNTNTLYAEGARQTLLEWGQLPHLVRQGTARIRLTLDHPTDYTVHALSTSGRRVSEVKTIAHDDTLEFTCNVDGGADGARMLYEVVRKK